MYMYILINIHRLAMQKSMAWLVYSITILHSSNISSTSITSYCECHFVEDS